MAQETGRTWSEGNDPNDPPQQLFVPTEPKDHNVSLLWHRGHPLLFYYRRSPASTSKTYDLLLGPIAVNFALLCDAWVWHPVGADGSPGVPFAGFSCKTDSTRLIPPNPAQSLKVRAIDGIAVDPPVPPKFDGLPAFFNPPYIEEVRIKMGFSDDAAGAQLKKRVPEGDHARGDVSESQSYSLGLGFFGTDLTSSLNYSWSESSSMSLKDYRISSNSTLARTLHKISLAMLDRGAQYGAGVRKPWGPWVSTKSHKVPPMATQDMELNVSAVWVLPIPSKDLEFVVSVEVDFILVAQAAQAFEAYPAGSGGGTGNRLAAFNKRTVIFQRTITVPASRFKTEGLSDG